MSNSWKAFILACESLALVVATAHPGEPEHPVDSRHPMQLISQNGKEAAPPPPANGERPHAKPNATPDFGRHYIPPPPVPPQPVDLETVERERQQAPPAVEPLTLQAVEALAIQNNPTLRQAQDQIRGELGKAIEAGLWPNPVVGYIAEQIGVEGTPGEFQGGFVRQEIVTARKRRISREKYLQRVKVAEWESLAQQYRVLNDVRIHFYRALGQQGLVQVQRQLLKNSEDNLLTVREMYNVGQATAAQVHQANAALQRQRLNRLMAENDFRQTLEMLAALVGAELSACPLGGELEGEPVLIEWHPALDRILAESPEVQMAHAKLQEDQITLRRERVEPIPNVFVQGAVGQNFEAKQAVASAQVFFEVPLFDRNQGTIRQAQADLDRQFGEIRRTELRLKQQLAEQYRKYLTALQHVQNYQAVVLPEARKAYEILLDSYKEDRVAWPVVLDAERKYQEFRGVYIQNLIAWREAEVLIHGFLLHGGLEAPTRPTPPGHIDSVPQPR